MSFPKIRFGRDSPHRAESLSAPARSQTSIGTMRYVRRRPFKSRCRLETENLLLRQQLTVDAADLRNDAQRPSARPRKQAGAE